jgi:hypothetical protein
MPGVSANAAIAMTRIFADVCMVLTPNRLSPSFGRGGRGVNAKKNQPVT